MSKVSRGQTAGRQHQTCERSGVSGLPRQIFTYWHQGFESSPPVIGVCARSLVRCNPDWSQQLLDAGSVQRWIEPIPIPERTWNRMSLAHRSDVIRTQLLIRHGGVWADPTVLFTRPLDDWLFDCMDAGVFMFHRPGRDRAVSNWFIAAEPNQPLLVRLYEALCRYWRENNFHNLDHPASPLARFAGRVLNRNLELPRLWLRKPVIRFLKAYPYMIYHYMVHDLVRSETALQDIWDRMPKISADLPHFAAHCGLLEPLNDDAKRFIDGDQTPVHKLTWKLSAQGVPHESVLAYLFERFAPDHPALKRIAP